MSNGQHRYVWRIVFQNFINSLKPRQVTGNKIASDYQGNTYFEIPPDRSRGKRRAERWYDPPKGSDFQTPIPAEWEAWLRQRRTNAPTEEEIQKNLAVAQMKQMNAARLEQERIEELTRLGKPIELPKPIKGPDSFPKYEEYHYGGGDKPK